MPEIQINTPSNNHGGAMAAGDPKWIVWHSVEAPSVDGLAKSLAGGYLQHPSPPVSVHSITDPSITVTMVAENVQAWHAGPHANAHGLGNEQCGYARFTRDEWMSPKSFAVIRLTAQHAAAQGKRHGIPARWLSIAQIRNGEKGHCFHSDITLAFPGDTSHTDPGKGFPADKAIQMVQQWTSGVVVSPTPNPNPTPAGPVVGGAQAEDDMAYIFFTYPEVAARADGTRGSRVFVSDGVFFRHVEDMENLAHEVWRLRSLGVTPKYVTDSKFQLTDVPGSASPADAANAIASSKWVDDPHAYGRDFAELLPK